MYMNDLAKVTVLLPKNYYLNKNLYSRKQLIPENIS